MISRKYYSMTLVKAWKERPFRIALISMRTIIMGSCSGEERLDSTLDIAWGKWELI
jgi:hypothetical protein